MASSININSKRLPNSIMELVDLAIFAFASQSGLTSSDKVRGDPVIEGVCAFLGDLINCAKEETRNTFDAVSEVRLGSWQPGTHPTKEMYQMLSSRLQLSKSKGSIGERAGPKVPGRLLERTQTYNEALDRVTTNSNDPRCWRCSQVCRYCKHIDWKFVNKFRVDLVIPYLNVMEELLDNEEYSDDENDEALSDEEKMLGYEDPGCEPELYATLTSAEEIVDTDDSEECTDKEKDDGCRDDNDFSDNSIDDADDNNTDTD